MDEIKDQISLLRKEYTLAELIENNVEKNPFKQFEKWFKEAISAQLYEPNAMALATVSPYGKPSVRMVLLKEFRENGLVFFSNYGSKKAYDLHFNLNAALTFYWGELQRQVRIEGKIDFLSDDESDEYFQQRPRGSQLASIASEQSKIIENREVLEQKFNDLEKLYENKKVYRPSNWGGYILKPEKIEFWQGRENRLHDRLIFELVGLGEWKLYRMAP